jgi:DNA-binding XRE family transcriptional regulator
MTRLKQTLQEQGRTTTWLANQLEVSRTTAHSWTSGKTKPEDHRKETISKLLGISIEELFFADNGGGK